MHWLLPLGVFAGWQVIVWQPALFMPAAGSIVAFSAGGLWLYNRFRRGSKSFWLLITPPAAIIMATTFFLLFLRYPWLQVLIAVGVTAALIGYLNALRAFLFHISSYRPLTLETYTLYFAIATYSMAAVVAFGVMNFLQVPAWQSALGAAAVTYGLSYQYLWINKIDEPHALFGSVLLAIVMVELLWAMSFFSVSHFVTGFSLTVIYYAVLNLSLLHFLETLEQKIMRLYIGIGILSVVAMLLSAKWL